MKEENGRDSEGNMKGKVFFFQQIYPRKGSNETSRKSADSWTSLLFFLLFLCNVFKDIIVVKCLVCERAESLAPKGVMELVCIIKTRIVTVVTGSFISFLHPKVLESAGGKEK